MMPELKEKEIEELRQIISRTDKSGNEKLFLLMDFIYKRESFHKAKSLTKEEVEQGRSNAYKYLYL